MNLRTRIAGLFEGVVIALDAIRSNKVRAGLTIGLRRVEIETSPTLLLSPGIHHGAVWVTLRQLDIFPLLGWVAMARCGIARMRVGAIVVLAICFVLFALEALVRVQFSWVIEAGMRLSLLPET